MASPKTPSVRTIGENLAVKYDSASGIGDPILLYGIQIGHMVSVGDTNSPRQGNVCLRSVYRGSIYFHHCRIREEGRTTKSVLNKIARKIGHYCRTIGYYCRTNGRAFPTMQELAVYHAIMALLPGDTHPSMWSRFLSPFGNNGLTQITEALGYPDIYVWVGTADNDPFEIAVKASGETKPGCSWSHMNLILLQPAFGDDGSSASLARAIVDNWEDLRKALNHASV